jgi:hypothetical protein
VHCDRQELYADEVIVDEREKFLGWISEIPFEKIHEDMFAKKHPGTGDWLLRTAKFQEWFDTSGSALLWCHGKRECCDRNMLLEADGQQLALANRCLRGFLQLLKSRINSNSLL